MLHLGHVMMSQANQKQIRDIDWEYSASAVMLDITISPEFKQHA